jgi:excisionase family DNA binding protein
MEKMALEELMNIKEAATYLRLNYMTVYKLAQKRRIPASKVGGNWRFKKEILDNWLRQISSVAQGSILVVDDDLMIRELLKEMIPAQNYVVTTAGNGEEALAEISKKHYDLVFLDLILPGVSGIDILDAIKEKDRDTVVVIVTGHADEPVALQAMAKGPLLLIRKPFREKDITEVLNMVMKGKGAGLQ